MAAKIKCRCDDCKHESWHDPKDFERPERVTCPNCGSVHLESVGHQGTPPKKVFRRWMP